MPITIFTNIPALRAQEQVRRSTFDLEGTYTRLSSGLRINKASDDAAGLAVAENLRADQRIANVAIRNINDGLSLVSVAENALSEITNILTRMGELATQKMNGTISTVQISPLYNEYVALGSEINRIVRTSKFNGITLLSTTERIAIQVGLESSSNSQIILNDRIIDTEALGIRLDGPGYMTPDVVRSAIETVGNSQMYNAKRLEFALSNVTNMRENFMGAESAIRDADYAKESADLVRGRILQQSGVAILSQANIQPSFALKLLPPLYGNK